MSKQRATLEELLRLIDLCEVVERRGIDPFEVDVHGSLMTLKRCLPQLKDFDELLLDAEALDNIATIVRLQARWLRNKASSLHTDPILVELKIRVSNEDELADVFARSWHPIISLSQISPTRLRQAMDYWSNLPSLADRNKSDLPQPMGTFSDLSLAELVRLKAIAPEEFNSLLMRLLGELKDRANYGELDYWEFISTKVFQETVLRAYLTAFLVSENYAQLKVDHIEQKITIRPRGNMPQEPKIAPHSIVTSLNYRDWCKMTDVFTR